MTTCPMNQRCGSPLAARALNRSPQPAPNAPVGLTDGNDLTVAGLVSHWPIDTQEHYARVLDRYICSGVRWLDVGWQVLPDWAMAPVKQNELISRARFLVG